MNPEESTDTGNASIPNTSRQSTGSDNKMELTQAEYDFARDIKGLVEATPHVKNLMDFDYVCYAIAAENETLEQVLARIFTMQCFREHYNIQDTREEGIEIIHQRMGLQQPYMLLEMDYIERNQSFCSVVDLAQFFPSRAKTQSDYRILLGGAYYTWHCQFPEFRSLRTGATLLVECMDATLENFDRRVHHRLLHELMKCYPQVDKAIYFLHSSLVPSMMYNFTKKFLPDKIKNSFHLDYHIEGLEDQRIDGLYKQPTPELAQARLIVKINQFLRDRYRNRESFRLDSASIVPDSEIFCPIPTKETPVAG